MIRVMIAEDQAMVRGALASLLGLEDDIEVVAQVPRGDQVIDAARASDPDVALLDIEMPGMTGLEAADALRTAMPACKVLILTTFGRPGRRPPGSPRRRAGSEAVHRFGPMNWSSSATSALRETYTRLVEHV
jgi:CheY-like chemotaxis protein